MLRMLHASATAWPPLSRTTPRTPRRARRVENVQGRSQPLQHLVRRSRRERRPSRHRGRDERRAQFRALQDHAAAARAPRSPPLYRAAAVGLAGYLDAAGRRQDHFRTAVVDARRELGRREAAEHHGMDRAEACARASRIPPAAPSACRSLRCRREPPRARAARASRATSACSSANV